MAILISVIKYPKYDKKCDSTIGFWTLNFLRRKFVIICFLGGELVPHFKALAVNEIKVLNNICSNTLFPQFHK